MSIGSGGDDNNDEFHGDNELQADEPNRFFGVKKEPDPQDGSIELPCQVPLLDSKSEHAEPVNEEGFAEINNSVDTLVESVSCLYDDNVQLFTTTSQLQKQIVELKKDKDIMKEMMESMMQMFHAVQLNNHMLQNEMDTIKETMNNGSHHTSTDGTYLWKISDIANKIAAANSEQQTSIYSPPFYTSPTGYKMCMRLYLAGDGQARRTHISLFLVLLRGDFDAMLTWPFTNKISFCLYDQTAAQRHVLDSFRPDPKSNSFQRPRSSMNIASGIPKFFPLSVIQQDNNSYVRDDSMFIRCIIDFSSTPKAVLPFVCSLNPSLPEPIRHRLIHEEIERFNSAKSKTSIPETELKDAAST